MPAEYGVSFPVLKDEGNIVADRLQANRTCEALVIDAKGVLRYRGAIDDQYRIGVRKERKVAALPGRGDRQGARRSGDRDARNQRGRLPDRTCGRAPGDCRPAASRWIACGPLPT